MRMIDLTGMTFGALTVIRKATPTEQLYSRPSWICNCSCGRKKVVTGDNLRSGKVTSCGCRAASSVKRRVPNTSARKDITGETHGELTAIEFVRGGVWLWRCSCGNTVTASVDAVRRGKIVSCGHVLKETARRKVTEQNVLGHVGGTSLSVISGIMSGTVRSSNSSGVTGVKIRKRKAGVVYVASITFKGKEHHLGTFATLEQAAQARRQAEADMFGTELEQNGWKKNTQK